MFQFKSTFSNSRRESGYVTQDSLLAFPAKDKYNNMTYRSVVLLLFIAVFAFNLSQLTDDKRIHLN